MWQGNFVLDIQAAGEQTSCAITQDAPAVVSRSPHARLVSATGGTITFPAAGMYKITAAPSKRPESKVGIMLRSVRFDPVSQSGL